jgi:hypothetical protein
MRKRTRRLTLHRETLLRLDETSLRRLPAGGARIVQDTEPDCASPLCGPTYWESCEPCGLG